MVWNIVSILYHIAHIALFLKSYILSYIFISINVYFLVGCVFFDRGTECDISYML